jgi:DNA polymerase III subunit delta'
MEEFLPNSTPILLGHEQAEKSFLDTFLSGKMHHAWILHGVEGIGKATFAYKIARFLISGIGDQDGGFLNETVTSLGLSENHEVFKTIAAKSCPDLLVVEREFDEKTGKHKKGIVVDDIRKINEFMHKTSSDGNYRVVIVDGADKMNNNSQNAILKVLEEPPAKTVILLTANNIGAFLPTIKSRCRSLKLDPISQDNISTLMSKFYPTLTDEDKNKISMLSEGSIGEAMQIQKCDGIQVYEDMLALLSKNIDAKQVHKFCEEYGYAKNDEKYQLLTTMLENFFSKKILSIAKNKPMENITGLEEIILQDASVESLLSQKENIEKLISDAEISNLDRNKILLYIFSTLI